MSLETAARNVVRMRRRFEKSKGKNLVLIHGAYRNALDELKKEVEKLDKEENTK